MTLAEGTDKAPVRSLEMIQIEDNFFTIIYGDRFADRLAKDEALGVVAAILFGGKPPHYMNTYEGWLRREKIHNHDIGNPVALLPEKPSNLIPFGGNMLTEYEELPVRYRAKLEGMQLTVEEVSAHIYRRFGTVGTGVTKLEAVEILKKSIMDKFLSHMSAIDWQARPFT